MKTSLPTTAIPPITALVGLLLIPGAIQAQGWKLVGITGQQSNAGDLDPQGEFLYPDNTLFEISLTNGAITKLFRTTWVPDSQSIGFNPVDGLLYHTAGANAYRDDPLRAGHDQGGPDIPGLAFQDNYYMEKIDLVTRAMTGVFNANPPPNPDETLPAFGLVAPRPTWALPVARRDATQTDPSFRQKGENEYSALRGMAWSAEKNLFYVSDGEGIFTLTPTGASTFLSRPAFPSDGANGEAKGIAFVKAAELVVGYRDPTGPNGFLMRLNPETGEVTGELPLTYPPGGGDPVDEFNGLLGLAQHPVTEVVYGIRQTADNFSRELVTINPATGATALVGNMGMHVSSIAFAATGVPAAPWRLIGITGQQSNAGDLDPQGEFLYPDNTLFEISLTNGAVTKLFRTTWVPDSQSIGFNPVDGLLYHTAGANAYRDDPLRAGHDQGGPDIPGLAFQDNYYMEKIDLVTRAMTGVFNSNPPPNPDETLPAFGLVAPRPTWALPVARRDATQTDPSFRQKGENEYSALRGMAWSSEKNLFYVSDGEGIFTLTPTGASTFLSRPAFPSDGANGEAKGIAFIKARELVVGYRDPTGPNGFLMRLNPETGEVTGELPLTYPPGGGDPVDEFNGLLGIAQHPVTEVIYGIRQTADNFSRELVTINPSTGATTLVGNMGMHVSSLAFVPAGVPSPAPIIQTVTVAGNNITITWSGGTAPYQLQTTTTLATGSWANLGAPTSTTSTTVPLDGPLRFYQIQGQ